MLDLFTYIFMMFELITIDSHFYSIYLFANEHFLVRKETKDSTS